MAAAIGVGGVFIKTPDRERFVAWYRDVLGLEMDPEHGSMLIYEHAHKAFGMGARTVFSPFDADSAYFTPSQHDVMVNFIVDDLDGVLARADAHGATRAGEPETYEYGRFAWLVDPDGRKIELWEPAQPPQS